MVNGEISNIYPILPLESLFYILNSEKLFIEAWLTADWFSLDVRPAVRGGEMKLQSIKNRFPIQKVYVNFHI